MGRALGIDLGTTNSVVAVADGAEVRVLADAHGHVLLPSIVSFTEDGRVLVGEAAREQRLLDPESTIYSVKRLIGRPFDSPEVQRAQERFAFRLVSGPNESVRVMVHGEPFALAEISAWVLREVRRVAEHALGETCDRCVLTVPANFDELQRSATRAAAQVAGLDVMRVIHEPTAAALAYGYGYGERANQRVVVYDLGGGTFDVTVLELEDDVFEVVSTAGDTFLGGDDVDSVVIGRMAESFEARHGWDPRTAWHSFERLRNAAEWAKRQLSFDDAVRVQVAELALTEDGRALDLDFEMTRAELEALIRPVLLRSFEVCAEALRAADIGPKDLDRVILVGGSTRIPLVRAMVKRFFKREPLTRIDPDLVVAQGAAIHAFALSGGARVVPRPTKPGSGSQPTPSVPPLPLDAVPAPRPRMSSMPPPWEDSVEIDPAYAAELASIVPRPSDQPPTDASTPSFELPPAPAPLLMDVTPHSLGVETAGGFCRRVIARNAPIPSEQTRVFTTAHDDQDTVRARICQGESRVFGENQVLGEIELTGLRRAPRGEVKIEVTFLLDAGGSLSVTARDEETGREERIEVRLRGGLTRDEVARMYGRQESFSSGARGGG